MSAEQIQTALKILKGAGVRMTPQRHAILSYLMNTKSHPTVDEIYKSLGGKFPSMSVATIYNNLKMFKDLDLVKELTYGDSSSRFDANMEEHYHVVCLKCGTIEDFYYSGLHQVEEEASTSTGFKVISHRMEVYGVCSDCQVQH
ncbi:Fur family transcriptional regulator [Aneurinibacillus terranovensis]|uniref:Fur family transcriptional regulator n=1 Tax=Aneurinibacillus terranovensis TaxID=278991 RepID=UPI00041F6F5B|nr:Fur family transcriptional regulator [Aneurinibacillus terranovensis]